MVIKQRVNDIELLPTRGDMLYVIAVGVLDVIEQLLPSPEVPPRAEQASFRNPNRTAPLRAIGHTSLIATDLITQLAEQLLSDADGPFVSTTVFLVLVWSRSKLCIVELKR